MPHFIFDDFVRTTLGAATNKADGSPLSPQQMDRVIDYLKSPGSGPDSTKSYAEFLEGKLRDLPPGLPPGIDYVGFSGTDSTNTSNFSNATFYKDDLGGKARVIGDTPWGKYIQSLEDVPGQHPDFAVIEGNFKSFMQAEGVRPLRDNHGGALRDMMWNAGSPRYFENAIATGKPLVAFVENAPPNRGFSNFELTTALEHPHVRINGYPVSAFGPEPLSFISNSAAEYQALERVIAQQAATNSGHPVSVAQVRAQLKPIDGYDAVKQTLFAHPVDEFKALSLGEMSHARAGWVASRASLASGPRLYAELPEPLPHGPNQPGAPRGPPGLAATAAEMAADSAPRSVGAGISPAMKVAGVAGVALLAHDFATSGHKWVTLNAQGNAAGADSTAAHFVGRNVGGALGGFGAGAGVGLATGSWTGPGALLVGLGGGVLGAYLGEAWADQKDIDRIYTQVDPMGRTWTRHPTDEDGRWQRGGYQQQVQGADLGGGVEVRPVQTALGEDVTVRTGYVATGTLERQLNWQAATASYELGLRAPPPPQDPYRLNASGEQLPPRAAFETGRSFVRDPLSQQWELEIKEVVDGRVPLTRHEPVSGERAQALDEQSRTVIAQNAANTPAAIAARYMVAYEQQRWSDFGDPEHPSVPLAIQDAQRRADTLQASDGNSYTRREDGQWISKGVILDSTANRNVSEELDVTWQSQMSGIAGLNAMAEEIKANVQLAPEGVHGQVAALYERHGIERTPGQLAATAAAVEQNLSSTDRQGDLVLELIPDPRTHVPSAESAIAAFGDAGGNRMVLTATTTMEDVAKIQALHQQPAPAQVAGGYAHVPTLETVTVSPSEDRPVPDAPELRIAALSAQQRDAHEQALREANRQGLSTGEAQQVAAVAALGDVTGRVDEALAAKLSHRHEPARQEPSAPAVTAIAASTPAPAWLPDAEPVRERQSEQDHQNEAVRAETQRAQVSGEAEDAVRQQSHSQATGIDETAAQMQATHSKPLQAEPLTAGSATHSPLRGEEPAGAAASHPHLQAETSNTLQQRSVSPSAELPLPRDDHREPTPPLADEALMQHHLIPPSAAAEWEQAPRSVAFAHEAGRLQEALPAHQEARASHDDGLAEVAEIARAEPIEMEPLFEREQPAPLKMSPTHPDHPDHKLYEQIREGVAALDAQHGRTPDAMSERLTASLLVLAKDNGLDRVDHVVLSQATANAGSGQNVFVVQGEFNNPAQLRAGMPTEQAVTTPWEESMQQFDAVAEERQARAQQQALQQQDEDQRVQHEIQIAAASVGG